MGGKGNFFAIDLPTFDKVCALGDPDVAASYLVLAAGTGADNRTSSWSREAINRRTNLNWRKADAAILKLEGAGLVRWIAKNTRKTRIDLVPVETRIGMGPAAKSVVERIRNGGLPKPSEERAVNEALSKGWINTDDEGSYSCVENVGSKPVWLPKSIVGDELGRTIDGTTIVERIRKGRDALAFHLLAHLAYRQNLAELWGIDRYILGKTFNAETVHQTPSLNVIQFSRDESYMRWTEDTAAHKQADKDKGLRAFFDRVRFLEDVGAIEWAYFVAEDDSHDSILMFPVALVRHDKLVLDQPETITGVYGNAAACAIAERSWQDWEALAPGHFMLPVDRMNRKAAMVGVPRLRGMAKTRNASRWQRERMDVCREWIAVFRAILDEHCPDVLENLDQRFADFNGEFNSGSTVLQRDINDTSESDMHAPRPSDGRQTGSRSAGVL